MCTGAIISRNIAETGRPILLKHRDISFSLSNHRGNRIEYESSVRFGKKGIISVVDSHSLDECSSLCGMNVAGFAIINTATYNLGTRDFNNQIAPSKLMYKALAECENAIGFEKMLERTARKMMPANYGIIDKDGNAFYYEVGEVSWTRIDVNNVKDNHITFTNFSQSGNKNNRIGLERCVTATAIMNETIEREKIITPRSLFDHISRSFRNEFINIDLKKQDNPFGDYFIDGIFIPLKTTTFSAAFQGGVAWVMLGYPPASVVVPVLMNRELPPFMCKSGEWQTAKICNKSFELKKKIFDINVGEGNKYFNFNRLYNTAGTGYMQQIEELEDWMYENFDPTFSEISLADFYKEYYNRIENTYNCILSEKTKDDQYSEFRLCGFDQKFDIIIPRKECYAKRVLKTLLNK